MLRSPAYQPLSRKPFDESQPGKAEIAFESLRPFFRSKWLFVMVLVLMCLQFWKPMIGGFGPGILFLVVSMPNIIRNSRLRKIRGTVELQLASRELSSREIWAEYRGVDDPEFYFFARHCSVLAKRAARWELDRFLPADEVAAIFYPPEGWTPRTVVQNLQIEAPFEISDEEIATLSQKTWGEFVSFCYDRMQEARSAPAEATVPAEDTIKSC